MVNPPPNLPPAAQPWGRSVDERLRDADRALESLALKTGNAFLGMNSALDQVLAQQKTILAQNLVILQQQEDLAEQQAQILDVVANQVTSSSGNASAGYPAFSAPTSMTDYATVTLAVPTGYSRASVTGVISGLFVTSSTPEAAQYVVRIQGSDGPLGTSFPLATNGEIFSNSYARTLTGLSGGNVTISARLSATGSSASFGGISTSASIIWLK